MLILTCQIKKDYKMNSSYKLTSLLVIVTAFLLFACTPKSEKSDPAMSVEVTSEPPKTVDVEFTLKTIAENGKLAYIGIGGEIDDIVNPDLIVQPGAVVRIILVNGDGMPHDLFLPDLDIKTTYVSKIGEQTEIVFEVGDMQPGTYVYYCTVPGHRQAGQEGKFVVVKP